MMWLLRRAALWGGTLAVLAGVVVVVAGPVGPVGALAALPPLVVLAGLAAAAGLLLRSGDGADAASPPWTDEGALARTAPERTPEEPSLSGEAFSEVVAAAGKTARAEDSVEAGLAVVRPDLRAALTAALVQGGADPDRVEAALDDGSWTDDRAAAAVLADGIAPPNRPLRRRVEAWLHPERVVARRTARAVRAVGRAAEAALPPIPGQSAPRTVEVVPPALSELTRAADGSLRRAADGAPVGEGAAADATDETATTATTQEVDE